MVLLGIILVGCASFIIAWFLGPRFVHSDIENVTGSRGTGRAKVSRYTSLLVHTNLVQSSRLAALKIRMLEDQIRNAPQPPVSSFGQRPIRDEQSGLIVGWE